MFSFVWSCGGEDPAQAIKEMLKLNFAISVATALSCRSAGKCLSLDTVHVSPWILVRWCMDANVRTGVPNAVVKWPNDVWCGGRKVSGMLVDVEKTTAFPGVGINVNWVRCCPLLCTWQFSRQQPHQVTKEKYFR